jgi:hypothetical protein
MMEADAGDFSPKSYFGNWIIPYRTIFSPVGEKIEQMSGRTVEQVNGNVEQAGLLVRVDLNCGLLFNCSPDHLLA